MASKTFCLFISIFFVCSFAQAQNLGSNSILGSLSSQESTLAIYPFIAEIDTKEVNVRAGQSLNFEKLCALKKGEKVIVLDKSYSWYKIEIPQLSKTYVNSQYVRLLDNKTGEMIANRVNVRAGASSKHTVLGQLSEGERISIIEEFEQWYKIEPIADTYGWVMDKYLKFVSKDVDGFKKKAVLSKVIQIEKEEKSVDLKKEESAAVVKKEIVAKGEPAKCEIEKGKKKVLPHIEIGNGQVRVTGILKPQKNKSLKYVQYKLHVNKEVFYYVESFQYIFDEFLNYKVLINGSLNTELQEKYSHPVVTISTIELVL